MGVIVRYMGIEGGGCRAGLEYNDSRCGEDPVSHSDSLNRRAPRDDVVLVASECFSKASFVTHSDFRPSYLWLALIYKRAHVIGAEQ